MARDAIFQRFLQNQAAEAQALNAASDVVSITPLASGPGAAQHFLARFSCGGYIKNEAGAIVKHNRWDVGVYFPDDYLRCANPGQVVTLLAPQAVFHPNIRDGHVCMGERFLAPGTALVEIIHQVHAILTYNKWSGQGLNEDASLWAMSNASLLPADRRSLKRRVLRLDIEVAGANGGRS